MRRILSLIIPIAILTIYDPESCFAHSDTLEYQHLCIDFNDITEKNEDNGVNEFLLTQIISTIISIIALLVGWLQLRKQIKATRKDILSQYNLERTSLLLDAITQLILEISLDQGNFAKGKYVTNNHILLEKRIVLLLDKNIELERRLSEYIEGLTAGQNNTMTKQDTIKVIEELSNQIINNKINNL